MLYAIKNSYGTDKKKCGDAWNKSCCEVSETLIMYPFPGKKWGRPPAASPPHYTSESLYITTLWTLFCVCIHRHRSGWNSGGTHGEGRRWIGAEYGEGCPLFSRLGCMGSVVSGAPAKNGFWRILKVTERSFLYLYGKICGG